ncbi:MAG: mevalonate kinase [Deltaproteobacteria bacterium]|nr:MAG: mevalonate kinase [Deltaproteobacteria bacterium]
MTVAFGKVILLGEHAVVYGHPAVAGALGFGVVATARRTGAGPSRLSVPAWDAAATAGDGTAVGAALAAIVGAVTGAPSDAAFAVDARADLPPAAGLGSSAALAVATTRAVAAAAGVSLAAGDVDRIANLAERAFHANPSGVDVALAARGGLGVFRRGAGFAPLAAPPLRAAVGLSGQPRSTGAMVERVAAARAADPAQAARVDRLGALAAAGATALAAGDLAQVGALMDEAHALLAALGVSTPALDRLVAIARDAGAAGAKLTGAGGGGAVVALAPGREEDVVAAWRAAGFDGFACDVGATRPSPEGGR